MAEVNQGLSRSRRIIVIALPGPDNILNDRVNRRVAHCITLPRGWDLGTWCRVSAGKRARCLNLQVYMGRRGRVYQYIEPMAVRFSGGNSTADGDAFGLMSAQPCPPVLPVESHERHVFGLSIASAFLCRRTVPHRDETSHSLSGAQCLGNNISRVIAADRRGGACSGALIRL